MISLVLPYWQRQAAADRGLATLASVYRDLDLEVVLVDDGSPDPFKPERCYPFDLRVVRLPDKAGPLAPTAAWNAGVAYARSEFIALSSPEMLHEKPVLPALLETIRDDAKAYALAAVWCPEQEAWHCRSDRERNFDVPFPAHADLNFCSMMHRSLWDATGGFDEAFRDGGCYEDADFAHRLLAAGARFIFRDDLIVTHPKTGARIRWPRPGVARNRALYLQKWYPDHQDGRS